MANQKKKHKAARSLKINDLVICFPDPEKKEREQIIQQLITDSRMVDLDKLQLLIDAAAVWRAESRVMVR